MVVDPDGYTPIYTSEATFKDGVGKDPTAPVAPLREDFAIGEVARQFPRAEGLVQPFITATETG